MRNPSCSNNLQDCYLPRAINIALTELFRNGNYTISTRLISLTLP